MRVFKLIGKNSIRHPLRTSLTILGVAIAVTAFCVIRSAIDAWYLNSSAASPDRLISRNAISLGFNLPLAYRNKVERIDGIKQVAHATWFGGKYIDDKNFFAKFAVDEDVYFDMHPEYLVSDEEWQAFKRDRNAALVGRQLADRFGWQVGDQIRIEGDIYPGDWDFVIRGIFTGAEENTPESQFFFRYKYLDETLRQDWPSRAGYVGSFVIQIDDPQQAAQISEQVDALFANSLAETKTETEEAFRLGFVEMSKSIILGLRVISYLVIGVILLVLANTMAMSARERKSEYAVLKTLGFGRFHVIGLIYGESLMIALFGASLGVAMTFLTVPLLAAQISTFLPKLPIEPLTLILGIISAIVVGLMAAFFPSAQAVRTSIVEGLRQID